VVRRFSSKEETTTHCGRAWFDPAAFDDAPVLGFENHLNVVSRQQAGIDTGAGKWVAVFLKQTAVDENFRRFSGHYPRSMQLTSS